MQIKSNGRVNTARFLLLVSLGAFVLRVALTFALSTYKVVDDDTAHFGFGWEMGRVASSLLQGHGFSSPLPLPTGPTAIVGPVYPLFLAAIFKAFGVYSTASAIAARILQSLFASLTCVFVYLCARDSIGDRVGKLAAVAWALFPLNIFFTVWRIWETSLTAMIMALLFWLLLVARDSTSVARWSATGALLGAAALTNTSLVVIVVPFGLSALIRHRWRMARPALAGMLACFAVVSPWIARNEMQFGKFMLRSNFPLEFRVGNNELSYGQKIESFHPSNTPALNEHWSQIGELKYMEEDRQANSAFVKHHFGQFAFATFNRIVNYWTGGWVKTLPGDPNNWWLVIGTSIISFAGLLGLGRLFARRNSAAAMFAGCLVIYPVVYYLTTSQPRFYHALTPLLIVLIAAMIGQPKERVALGSSDGHTSQSLAEAPLAMGAHRS